MKTARKLSKDEANSARELGILAGGADLRFVERLQEIASISREDAWKAFGTMRKLKCVKRATLRSEWTVKHGSLLDADVIVRAVTWFD